ncbi:MAG: SiaB family protein kinase [Bacteroidota bacterium]
MGTSELKDIYSVYQNMIENDLIMIYEGEFSQEITKSVLSMAEKNFDSENIEAGIRKKVFNVMVEGLQNICKHQHEVDDKAENSSAIFMIAFNDDEYRIITGNLIDNTKIDIVKSKIDTINELDQEGLKGLYKEARLKSTISDVGGAGLGFIDMARKSGCKLVYSFNPVNPEISFFSLITTIKNTKE